MPLLTREIKRRIKSIKNTRQITRAMELVAASKMKKAVEAVLKSRAYANAAWQMAESIAENIQEEHPFLKPKHKAGKNLSLILSSNRGLCGSFNQQLILKADIFFKKMPPIEIITIGRKARDILSRLKYKIIADFDKKDNNISTSDVQSLSQFILKEYEKRLYDQVFLIYTDFISPLKQTPTIKQLLPLKRNSELGEAEKQGIAKDKKQESTQAKIKEKNNSDLKSTETANYLFEPSQETVLEALLPRLIELQLYQAYLESNACEHSARMFAMRNATDNAGTLIDELTLTYNYARQAAITQEIAEISSAKAALT